jgi:hypothetical protein
MCSAASFPTFPTPGSPSMSTGAFSRGLSLYTTMMSSNYAPSLISRLSLRLYSPYLSSGEYLAGMAITVAEPHSGHVALRV